MAQDKRLEAIGEALEPELLHTAIRPARTVDIAQDKGAPGGCRITEEAAFDTRELATGDEVILDYGNHEVGYLTLQLDYTGRHPDAPAWIEISFAEAPDELFQEVEDYHGWISSGWIQTERLHVDVLPAEIQMPRRYAFRYVRIRALNISMNFKLKVADASVDAVSSADDAALIRYDNTQDARAAELDRIAVRTLHECMQRVFEDGPKRDRRLWLGDLRLEALANYETYRKNDLVKRCLYLFAANPLDDGQIANNLFMDPVVEPDDNRMFDYSLLYIPTLVEYVRQTDDQEALQDLYPAAMKQLSLAREKFDADGILGDVSSMGLCFIDWNMMLDKQAAGQGVYLYCLNYAAELASMHGDETLADELRAEHEKKAAAAREHFFDPDKGVFVSGKNRQVSWASQAWLLLGDVLDDDAAGKVFDRMHVLQAESDEADAASKEPPFNMGRIDFGKTSLQEAAAMMARDAAAHPDRVQGMVSPYMYHVYVDALIHIGRMDEALQVLKDYWGGMADEGADTFWELYDPKNPNESPYGGTIVNSHCHAWSCAPAYFLRKYYR